MSASWKVYRYVCGGCHRVRREYVRKISFDFGSKMEMIGSDDHCGCRGSGLAIREDDVPEGCILVFDERPV